MSMNTSDAASGTQSSVPLAPSPVLELWRDLSMLRVWRHPDDWHHPSVDALVEALESGLDPLAAARRLGASRAQGGTGIDETIDDLACAYEAIGAQVPIDVMRAIACGWVTEREGHPVHTSFIRPVAGLHSAEYLEIRLRETFNDAARAGLGASTTHCLVVIDVALEACDVISRFKRTSAMGTILRSLYGDGHPMAMLCDGLFAVLLRRDADLGSQISNIRQRIVEAASHVPGASALRQPPTLWVQQLPQSSDDLALVLSDIHR